MKPDIDADAPASQKPLMAVVATNGSAAPATSNAFLGERGEDEQNPIFDNLVKVEGDIAGLVAYSIYKQNKRAWLQDFQRIVGRPPTDAEVRSYIIGESTTRRLAIYRHLADATLSGQGPETPTDAAKYNIGSRSSTKPTALSLMIAGIVLVAAVALLVFVLRNGIATGK